MEDEEGFFVQRAGDVILLKKNTKAEVLDKVT